MSKVEKVKQHFRDNKKLYLVGGVSAGVAVATTLVVVKFRATDAPVKIANHIVGDHNTILQTINIDMTRPGPKSFVIKCVDDQRVWPSIRAAAKDLDVHPGQISAQIKGLKDNLDGLHFEKVAEL